jgi:agmatinase
VQPITPLNLPFTGIATFAKFPLVTDPREWETLKPHAAVVGIPYDLGTQIRSGTRYGPRAVRELSTQYSGASYFDYDLQDNFFPSGLRFIDAGDADMVHHFADECLRRAEEKVLSLVEAGIMPVVLGGDHSITIPVLRALETKGPLCVVQIDAHLDFVDERQGIVHGQGNPMRRASEMRHVASMAQIGIRGPGSSRKEDFDAAKQFGSVIIGTREWQALGAREVAARIPDANAYYVTIDIDVLDAALAPGSGSPTPGGVSYREASDLLMEIANKGPVVGFDLVEVNPFFDPTGVTSLTAARLILDLLGAIYRHPH